MENLNLYSKSNLDMLENIEFEEKVDIDDLVLPSEPMKLAEIEIKQEPLKETIKFLLLNLIMKEINLN